MTKREKKTGKNSSCITAECQHERNRYYTIRCTRAYGLEAKTIKAVCQVMDQGTRRVRRAQPGRGSRVQRRGGDTGKQAHVNGTGPRPGVLPWRSLGGAAVAISGSRGLVTLVGRALDSWCIIPSYYTPAEYLTTPD